jgi:hypothetical protein
MVIPDSDPGEALVRSDKVEICAVLAKTHAVVVQGEDLALGNNSTLVDTRDTILVLVDIVAEVNDEVDVVFAGDVSVGVEVAVGCQSQI